MEPRTHARGNLSCTAKYGSVISCFNGATHSRAWKPAGGKMSLRRSMFASMEPRTHARGNRSIHYNLPLLRRCFNGATHSRAWKPEVDRAPAPRRTGFNGATHSRAWKQPHKQY